MFHSHADEGFPLEGPFPYLQGLLRRLRGNVKGQPAHQFLLGPAEDALRGRVDTHCFPLGVEHADGQGSCGEQGPEILIGLPELRRPVGHHFLQIFPVQPQFLLDLLHLGDIGEGDQVTFLPLSVQAEEDIQKQDQHLAVFILKMEFTPPFLAIRHLSQQFPERLLVLIGHEQREVLPQQATAFTSQERGRGEIGFHDLSQLVQRNVTHRGKVIEVAIFVAGFFQPGLDLPQLLVFQLQLDLMHLEFVDEAGGVLWG